ncbi:MAG: hypothetical protein ACRCYR_03660 [Phycicoccus sp.]
MYTAIILALPDGWLTTASVGAAAGVSDHAARPLVAELVRAGLLRQEKQVVPGSAGGAPYVRNRYAVAVPR